MRHWCAALVALAILGSATPAAARTPFLVQDINQIPNNDSSNPSIQAVIGGAAFFSAARNDIDRELWRTDGTENGTWQVADICPDCSGNPRPMMATSIGYFFAAVDDHGIGQLWITRGEPASTFRLTPETTFNVHRSPVWDDRRKLLFFVARDPHGAEIWRTDGTPAGTYRVTDINPQFESPSPGDLTLLGETLYFRADDGRRGPALWATDGTPQGTRLVKSFGSSSTAGGPKDLRVIGRALVFLETLPSREIGLWKSDGTTQGTLPLMSLGTRKLVEMTSHQAAGSRLFFTIAVGSNSSASLWVTNGTTNGTRKLGSFSRGFVQLTGATIGPRIVFRGASSAHGAELWITDGTPGGTRLLKDFCPGPCSSLAFPYFVYRNRLVVFASTPGQGDELWTTNGTPAGTRLLRDICPGSCDGFKGLLGVRKGRLFFFAGEEGSRQDLWSSDGTTQGTSLVHRFGPDETVAASLEDSSWAQLPTGFLFIVFDEVSGQEPWFTDGTSAGTRLVCDVAASVGGSEPEGLMRLGNEVLFFANDGVHGFELWRSDGTGPGTRLAAELTPGREPRSNPPAHGKSVEAGGQLFFSMGSELLGSGLWRTDGTQSGTLKVTPENLQRGSELAAVGALAFFNAGEAEEEIWVSDGTVDGTRKVGEAPGRLRRFTSFRGRLYFSTSEGQIWTSEGTPEGTGPLVATSALENIWLPTVHNDSLFFLAYDDESNQSQLWRTDGTSAGTTLVLDLDFIPGALVSTGERLFFSGYKHPHDELWASDGTTEGTSKIAEDLRLDGSITIFRGGLYVWTSDHTFWKSDGTVEGTELVDLEVEGIAVRGPAVAFGNRLYTTAQNALVETDGTPEGTRLIRGTSASWSLFFRREMVSAGSHLFFSAFDEEAGRELWALSAEDP